MKKTLKKAVQTGMKVNIIYVSQVKTMSKRTIFVISYTDERIVGYCYMRKHIRVFNIKNILAVEQCQNKMEVYV